MLATAALCLTGPVTARAQTASSSSWLDRLNAIRSDAGVAAVTEDASLSEGIRNHLVYLAKTPASMRTDQYASAHTENPASPYYTADGADEGASSDLVFGGATTAVDAINIWLSAPFHALGMLRPGLSEVGFYLDPTTGSAGLDVLTHLQSQSSTTPVLYPRTKLDILRFGGESPDPIETCTHNHPGTDWSNPGFPIIAMLPTGTDTDELSATLTAPDGSVLESTGSDLCLVSASTFYSSDPVYGNTGAELLDDDNAVFVISRTPLVQGQYAVHLALGADNSNQAIDWSFDAKAIDEPATVQVNSATCSYTASRTGDVTFSIGNPYHNYGPVTYTVAVDSARESQALDPGWSTSTGPFRVGAGRRSVEVSGSDGTHTDLRFPVPGCPAWQAARGRFTHYRRTHHRVTAILDNRRNTAAVVFHVVRGPRHTTVKVPGRTARSAAISLVRDHPKVVIRVAGNTIAHRRF